METNNHVGADGVPTSSNGSVRRQLTLRLEVADPDVVAELLKHEEGRARDDFASAALRLGVLALRQASGIMDADAVRQEGDRLLANIKEALSQSSATLVTDLKGTLGKYFDPNDGHLTERLNRLVKRDGGELEQLLQNHLDGDTSTLARTLADKVGENSPLFRILSPNQSDGLLKSLSNAIDAALKAQRDHIVNQFSLDDDQSALSRFRKEIADSNGKLTAKVSEDVDLVRREFSLDNDDGALARLVKQVTEAQEKISKEFSLDEDKSALSRISNLLTTTSETIKERLTLDDDKSPLFRLKRELMGVIKELSDNQIKFQEDVRVILDAAKARKDEANKSTRGGIAFEEAACLYIQDEAQRVGDVFEATGATTGRISLRKVGDAVITLGADCMAAGARIVVETKQKSGVRLTDALAELKIARDNRNAQIGIFVYSQAVAPEGIELLARYGNDVVTVWDQDDRSSDVYLRAAISLARALAMREKAAAAEAAEDLDAVEKAVRAFERVVKDIDQVLKWSTTISNNAGKIIEQVTKAKERLPVEIESLNAHVSRLRISGVAAS